MSELTTLAMSLGSGVLDEMKAFIGEEGWLTLTDQQKATIHGVATRVMEYRLKARINPTEDNKALLATYESATLDWKAWGEMAAEDAVESAFWKGVETVGSALGTFLGAAANKALDTIIPGF